MSELDEAIAAQEAARASLLTQLAPRRAEEARALALLTAELEARKARQLQLRSSIEKLEFAAHAEVDERARLQHGLSRLSRQWVRLVEPALASGAVLSVSIGLGLAPDARGAWLTAAAGLVVGLGVGQLAKRGR